uniref:Enoyl reductase (ER) domain-containing protein n=1 Tax=Erythrolobus australicus TaxID=1077150 RepID=A0A7S1XI02_9RHOD|mmetsp:Transcript_976/g.2760  ORF Transcript_976/g.2760 Transcript_976/m.2760 type:complete len:365 (+) Transcript_976:67-1161(+)
MKSCVGYAAFESSGKLSTYNFDRREPQDDDVMLEILYSGVCHSDVHWVRAEWNPSPPYPLVPGHEIVGRVAEVGAKVTKIAVGDIAAVGVQVDSCGECKCCSDQRDDPQYCTKGVFTYASPHGYPDSVESEKVTQGGYSTRIVTREKFVFSVPPALHKNLAGVAPLLCAGITTWAPLQYFAGGEAELRGKKLGVVGLGGLGHMAVKLGKALGCHVTVLSSSESKRKAAIDELGADAYLVHKDKEAMKDAQCSLDVVVDTVSADHDLEALVALLDVGGKYLVVGLPPHKLAFKNSWFVNKKRMLGGTLIGGPVMTQDLLNFCAERGVYADIELIKMDAINDAFERMLASDVKYRFVIDIASSKLE